MAEVTRSITFDVPAGEQGIQGVKGDPGVNGTNGTNGVQGVKGDPGLPGTNGTNGTNGAVGPIGPPGPAAVPRVNATWVQPDSGGNPTIDMGGVGFTKQTIVVKTGIAVFFSNMVEGAQCLLLVECAVAQGCLWAGVTWVEGLSPATQTPIPGKPGKLQGFTFTVDKKADGTLRLIGDVWRTFPK